MFRFGGHAKLLRAAFADAAIGVRRSVRPALFVVSGPLLLWASTGVSRAADMAFDLASLPGSETPGSASAAPVEPVPVPVAVAVAAEQAEHAQAAHPAAVGSTAVGPLAEEPSALPAAASDAPALHKQWKDVRDLELMFQALNLLDAVETVGCLEAGKCAERNPVYGKNPHRSVIVASKVATGALHYLVTRYMLKQHNAWTDEWLITTVAIQGGVVMWNARFCF